MNSDTICVKKTFPAKYIKYLSYGLYIIKQMYSSEEEYKQKAAEYLKLSESVNNIIDDIENGLTDENENEVKLIKKSLVKKPTRIRNPKPKQTITEQIVELANQPTIQRGPTNDVEYVIAESDSETEPEKEAPNVIVVENAPEVIVVEKAHELDASSACFSTHNIALFGFIGGSVGLLNNQYVEITPKSFSLYRGQGGEKAPDVIVVEKAPEVIVVEKAHEVIVVEKAPEVIVIEEVVKPVVIEEVVKPVVKKVAKKVTKKEAPNEEAPKVIETPNEEAPKVIETPKVIEAPKEEAPNEEKKVSKPRAKKQKKPEVVEVALVVEELSEENEM